MPQAKENHKGVLDSWGRRNNRKHSNRLCLQCGEEFRPYRAESKYCSRPCSWANNGKHQQTVNECWWVGDKGYITGWIRVNGKKVRKRYHRWVMEQHLKLTLPPNIVVHHKDENKQNNALENLQVMQFGVHSTNHNLKRIANEA